MSGKIRVTIWNEYRHERESDIVRSVYPDGIHVAIKQGLESDYTVHVATLDEHDNGLPDTKLNETDVLIWWGHKAHDDVSDETVQRVYDRVLKGMGLIVLHSAHFSKIFKKLMGTSCDLKWREANEKERIWVVAPGHPIVAGIGEYIELAEEEMYGEHFDIPQPDELVMLSWFEGGEVFRSGCCYTRGLGKIFYFRPGHETYPTYYNDDIRRVISNAVAWSAPNHREYPKYGNAVPSLESIKGRAE
jgi:trehalose utilization protein